MSGAQLAKGTRVAFEREGNILVAAYPNIKSAVKVGQGQDPNISGDGRFVAFEEHGHGSDRSFAIREAGTGRLVKRHPGTLPHLSPDGKRVAFSRFIGSRWTLWLSDIGLTAPRKLTSGKDSPSFSSGWTSKGLLIAYSEELGGSIYALNPGDGVVQKESVTQIAGKQDISIPFGCAWSDDLKRIVFEAQTGEELVGIGQPLTGLYLYDFATKRRRLLTPKGIIGTGPVWAGQNLLLFVEGKNKRGSSSSQVTSLALDASGATNERQLILPYAGSVSVARRGA